MLSAFGGERTGLSFWAGARGLGVSLGLPLIWAWRVGLRTYFSNPISYPPALVYGVRARAVTFLVPGVTSMCQIRAGSVRALSPSCLVIMMTFRFSCSFLPILFVSFCFFCRYPLTIRLVFP